MKHDPRCMAGLWMVVRAVGLILSRSGFAVYMWGNHLISFSWERLPPAYRYLLNERYRKRRQSILEDRGR